MFKRITIMGLLCMLLLPACEKETILENEVAANDPLNFNLSGLSSNNISAQPIQPDLPVLDTPIYLDGLEEELFIPTIANALNMGCEEIPFYIDTDYTVDNTGKIDLSLVFDPNDNCITNSGNLLSTSWSVMRRMGLYYLPVFNGNVGADNSIIDLSIGANVQNWSREVHFEAVYENVGNVKIDFVLNLLVENDGTRRMNVENATSTTQEDIVIVTPLGTDGTSGMPGPSCTILVLPVWGVDIKIEYACN